MRLRLALATLAVLSLFGSSARAEDEAARALDKPPERRTGIVLGTQIGAGLAGSSGYPNNATKIDNPDYYSASGMMSGTTTTVLILGAVADYLNFGFWFGGGVFKNDDWRSTGGGGGVRVEVFPLYSLVPKLADLGVAGQFGIGTSTLDGRFRPGVSSDGAQSFLGVGVFHEWKFARFLGGHFSLGPTLDYNVVTASSIERHSATLGVRLVFYGGP